MGKYTFTYTKKEFIESCIRMWWNMRRRRLSTLLAFLVLFFSYAYILRRFPYEFLLLLIILVFLEIGTIYARSKKELLFQECSVQIENGLFISRSASSYHETPCNQISCIKESKRLLMLGVLQKKNQFSWFLIPTRVFSCPKEQQDFLQNLKNSIFFPDALNNTLHEPEDFHFSFLADMDKWVQIETESWSVFHDRFRHDAKLSRTQLIYYIFLYIVGIGFLFLLDFLNIFSFAAMLLCIFLLSLRRRMNPEKSIRKSLQNSFMQNNLLGNWDISFTDSGITYTIAQKRKVSMPWSEFSWIAETEHVFYCMHKDNRRFIPLPKSCLSSYEQAQAWVWYCQKKGLVPVHIKMTSYIPTWLFRLLPAFSICLFLMAGVWIGYQNSNPASTAFPISVDSFPSDSPSLETQVATLRSLGLTVPDELITEALGAGTPKEETLREIIKDYPYTWLLMSLGMPEYNEDFEITGYPEEVYWFDFESWDLESDYIHILEGMAVLAKGSALEQVENIRVNTAKVDWEKGRGTLTVLLDYNGETLSYPMDVYYDWIDADVLNIYNALLEGTDSTKHFYAMGDNGQGAIIFFCNDEWAKKFEELTAIKLEKL